MRFSSVLANYEEKKQRTPSILNYTKQCGSFVVISESTIYTMMCNNLSWCKEIRSSLMMNWFTLLWYRSGSLTASLQPKLISFTHCSINLGNEKAWLWSLFPIQNICQATQETSFSSKHWILARSWRGWQRVHAAWYHTLQTVFQRISVTTLW